MSLSILRLLVSDEATSLDGLPGDLGGPPPSQRMRRANASWSVSYMQAGARLREAGALEAVDLNIEVLAAAVRRHSCS